MEKIIIEIVKKLVSRGIIKVIQPITEEGIASIIEDAISKISAKDLMKFLLK